MLQTSESSDRQDNAMQKIATGSVTRRLLSKANTKLHCTAPCVYYWLISVRHSRMLIVVFEHLWSLLNHIISVTLLNPFIIKAHLFWVNPRIISKQTCVQCTNKNVSLNLFISANFNARCLRFVQLNNPIPTCCSCRIYTWTGTQQIWKFYASICVKQQCVLLNHASLFFSFSNWLSTSKLNCHHMGALKTREKHDKLVYTKSNKLSLYKK